MDQQPLSHGTTAVYRYGEGPERLIALHAFGQSGRSFSGLDLSPQAAVWSPDLPFHGETRWRDVAFDPESLAHWLRELAEGEACYLLGYSYGARLAVAALPYLKGCLRALLLVAPDGLHTPGLKMLDALPGFLTQWLIGQLDAPGRRAWLAGQARKAGLLDPVQRRFVDRYVLPQEKWMHTTRPSWQAFPSFALPAARAVRLLQEASCPVWIALGDADPVVRADKIRRLLEGSPGVAFHDYRGGHRPSWRDLSPVIREWLASV